MMVFLVYDIDDYLIKGRVAIRESTKSALPFKLPLYMSMFVDPFVRGFFDFSH